MPIRVGTPDRWETITPAADWQTLKTPLKKGEFQVATDLFFVIVRFAESPGLQPDRPIQPAEALGNRLEAFVGKGVTKR